MTAPALAPVSGRLARVDRLHNSRNGNPRFRITLTFYGATGERSWNTAADHSFTYAVTNYRIGSRVTLTINGRGTITDMTTTTTTTEDNAR